MLGPLTHTHTYTVSHQPNVHVFGLPVEYGENPENGKGPARNSFSEASVVAIDTEERLKEGGTERQTEGEKVTLWSFSALSHSVFTYEL